MASCLFFPSWLSPTAGPTASLNAAAHSHRGPHALWRRGPTEEPRMSGEYRGRSGRCRTRRRRSSCRGGQSAARRLLRHVASELTAVDLSLCQLHAGGTPPRSRRRSPPPRRRMSEQPFASVRRLQPRRRCVCAAMRPVSALEMPVEVIFCVTAVVAVLRHAVATAFVVGHHRLLGPHQAWFGRTCQCAGLPCHAVLRMRTRILQLRPDRPPLPPCLSQHIVPHRRDGFARGFLSHRLPDCPVSW